MEYSYDPAGNINWIKDYNASGTQTQTFGYDYLNRLTSAVASGGSGGTYAKRVGEVISNSTILRQKRMHQISDILEEISSLLTLCGYEDEVVWLQQQAIQLRSTTIEAEMIALVTQVKAKIAGMGSLSDIYLLPPDDVKISKPEANQRLSELISDLDKRINTILHT
jgi:hypothetical protein